MNLTRIKTAVLLVSGLGLFHFLISSIIWAIHLYRSAHAMDFDFKDELPAFVRCILLLLCFTVALSVSKRSFRIAIVAAIFGVTLTGSFLAYDLSDPKHAQVWVFDNTSVRPRVLYFTWWLRPQRTLASQAKTQSNGLGQH